MSSGKWKFESLVFANLDLIMKRFERNKCPVSHKIIPTMKFLPLGINAHARLF